MHPTPAASNEPDPAIASRRRRARRKLWAAVLIAVGAGCYIVAAFADRWLSRVIFDTGNRDDHVYFALVGLGFLLIIIAAVLVLFNARSEADPSQARRRR